VKIAVIVGGAANFAAEVADTMELVGCADPTFFAVNDQIASFPRPCIAVTLHPGKLGLWKAARQNSRHPMPDEYWGHREAPGITRHTPDWLGSCGLFAVKIALVEYRIGKVILCGVPMTANGGHFARRRDWRDVQGFVPYWGQRIAEIAPHVRSWSGWTREQLGVPTREFLDDPAGNVPKISGRAVQGLRGTQKKDTRRLPGGDQFRQGLGRSPDRAVFIGGYAATAAARAKENAR
jgi:hypothetical protein